MACCLLPPLAACLPLEPHLFMHDIHFGSDAKSRPRPPPIMHALHPALRCLFQRYSPAMPRHAVPCHTRFHTFDPSPRLPASQPASQPLDGSRHSFFASLARPRRFPFPHETLYPARPSTYQSISALSPPPVRAPRKPNPRSIEMSYRRQRVLVNVSCSLSRRRVACWFSPARKPKWRAVAAPMLTFAPIMSRMRRDDYAKLPFSLSHHRGGMKVCRGLAPPAS
ncbi:hypothetical protein MAPG_07552 [Magnaporthiopsis poae ATCC 64411]|uniref:Uncharacterized protein n=1 Tax=Magnaporthiopsis poae (strain ATCC 64411 / 73-15) TaxID=644358 RepID=A0A0C4E4Z5_MAGP6|nr:hypothetical protein MAPG_07552 [Magnaporthiopsis poae ATCC 64411]